MIWTSDSPPPFAILYTSAAGRVEAGYSWTSWTAYSADGVELGTFDRAGQARDRCEDHHTTGR